MIRRAFITLLGGAAVWPLAARAQQGGRVRRIGVLMAGESDPFQKPFVSAFTQALADLGWTDGRNVRLDLRWGSGDINRIRGRVSVNQPFSSRFTSLRKRQSVASAMILLGFDLIMPASRSRSA